MTVGENVRKIRKEKGLSILDVREATGLSKSTISELENDKSSPTIETLQKIANALNVDVEDFFKTDLKEREKFIESLKPSTPEEALKLILSQPVLMAYGGYDLEKMSNEEILDLANDMLLAMKLSIEKKKRK